jgi:thiamine pyrophosphate-dependent acetolactate synthase large subunit-like protein
MSKNIEQSTYRTTKKKASTFSFYTFATRRKRYIKSSATDWMLLAQAYGIKGICLDSREHLIEQLESILHLDEVF